VRKTVESRTRATRLGFRVDEETKKLVERAAALERRSITDFCLTALTQASRETIERSQTLVLSTRDQKIFFDALMNPPEPNERLRAAFRAAEDRIRP
jgi:uncharacterized protein (DUF1778 family)